MKTTHRMPEPRVEKIVAESDAEYVHLLNSTARMPADDIHEYMARFSTCYEATSGVRVRFSSAEEFVADLISVGRLSQEGTTYTLFPPVILAM